MEIKNLLLSQPDHEEEKINTLSNILSAAYLIKRKRDNIFKHQKINEQEFIILNILFGQYPDALSHQQIRERIIDKTIDLSRRVNKMERRGLVTCVKNQNNRRVFDILVTGQGTELFNETAKCEYEMLRAVSALSDEDIKQFNSSARKIVGALSRPPIHMPIESVERSKLSVYK